MKNPTPQARFVQYVDVVNRALGAHRDEIPYKQIVEGAESVLSDKRLGIGVYTEDSRHPHAWFTVELDDGRFTLTEAGKASPDVTVKMNEAHIDEVLKNPRAYIEHPARLDLDWLKKRVGLN